MKGKTWKMFIVMNEVNRYYLCNVWSKYFEMCISVCGLPSSTVWEHSRDLESQQGPGWGRDLKLFNLGQNPDSSRKSEKICLGREIYFINEIDGVGPVDNRPSPD